MNSLLYYVPGFTSQSLSKADVVKVGLAYAFPDGAPKWSNAAPGTGPDGNSGAIWTDSDRYQYNLDLQTWAQCNDQFWVGYWNDAVPGPDDLARKRQLTGEFLELGDEQQWLIPIARRWSESDDPDRWFRPSIVLPAPLSFGKPGEVFIGAPAKRYAELWSICLADYRMQTNTTTEHDETIVGAIGSVYSAVNILSANYRVSTAEVELLGLFMQDTPRAILDIFGDWAEWSAIAKKKNAQLDEQRSSSGPKEGSPSTDQP